MGVPVQAHRHADWMASMALKALELWSLTAWLSSSTKRCHWMLATGLESPLTFLLRPCISLLSVSYVVTTISWAASFLTSRILHNAHQSGPVLPTLSSLSLSEPQTIVLNTRHFSICMGTADQDHAYHIWFVGQWCHTCRRPTAPTRVNRNACSQ